MPTRTSSGERLAAIRRDVTYGSAATTPPNAAAIAAQRTAPPSASAQNPSVAAHTASDMRSRVRTLQRVLRYVDGVAGAHEELRGLAVRDRLHGHRVLGDLAVGLTRDLH